MEKRNGIYYYDFWYKKKRYNKSTGERVLSKALRVERMVRNKAEQEFLAGPTVTMKQLGEFDLMRAQGRNEEYKTQLSVYWRRFAEFFDTADKVSFASLHGYIAWRQTQMTRFGEPPGSNTLNRELKCLKRGRWLGEASGYTVDWPPDKAWPVLGKENKRLILSARDDIEFKDIRVFLENLPVPARFQALFIVRTGLRKEEMHRVTLDALKREHGSWILQVIEKVTGEVPRPVPIADDLADILREHPEWLVAERKKSFLTASVRAGVPNITLRTLRGVFSSTAGGALDAPARDALMGHLRGSAANYDRINRDRRRKVVDFVASYWPTEIMAKK